MSQKRLKKKLRKTLLRKKKSGKSTSWVKKSRGKIKSGKNFSHLRKITAVLTETHYRRSPIMKGGLEIPCKLIIRMLRTSHNKSIAAHFEKLGAKFYSEPSDELIMGSFVEEPETSEPPKKKKKTGYAGVQDIRYFFMKK